MSQRNSPISEEMGATIKRVIDNALAKGHKPPGMSSFSRHEQGAIRVAAEALGINRITMKRWAERQERLAARGAPSHLPDWSLYRAAKPRVRLKADGRVVDQDDREVEIPGAEAEIRPTERQRLKDRIAALEAEKKALAREESRAEDLREAVFGLVDEPVEARPFVIRHASSASKAGTEYLPVLFTSDFQIGEVVLAKEMDGFNEFNMTVARARYERLINKTITILRDHVQRPTYPFMTYLRGGDAVSGDIHDELLITNDLTSVEQVRECVRLEAAGIKTLADEFGRVEVISIPGNHGRNTKKPFAKRYADTNYETIIAYWLESIFRGDDRVRFYTPPSGEALFKLYDWTFLLTHGDRIGTGGGQGFIGPLAPITRGGKKTHDAYAKLRHLVDYVLIGHFHTPAMIPGLIANGTLVGYNEYARRMKMEPGPAVQTLFTVHRDYCVEQYRQINLSGASRPGADAPHFEVMSYLGEAA